MQELKFIAAESDSSSLILRAVDADTEFFLPVTGDLRSFLLDAATSAPSPAQPVAPASASNPQPEAVETTEDPTPNPAADPASDAASTGASDSTSEATATSAGADSPDSSAEPAQPRPRRPRISLSPREIQARIRHGASVAELAEETGSDESRLEPYAWPILQERSRIADLAHSAHPVSSEGASNLTLWEVLATALAARGENLSDSEWNAYQNPSKKWIVTVTWEKSVAGQTSLHAAEFQLDLDPTGPSLAHPYNSIAGDLIDPRYGQPVRHVAPVTPLSAVPQHEADYPADDGRDQAGSARRHPSAAARHGDPSNNDSGTTPAGSPNDSDETPAEQTDEFLLHPQNQPDRSRRKRKAVTPHWEDVLLGVRTNPKKKK
ncbi:septation protein SepH [Corynebacterium falsenii]